MEQKYDETEILEGINEYISRLNELYGDRVIPNKGILADGTYVRINGTTIYNSGGLSLMDFRAKCFKRIHEDKLFVNAVKSLKDKFLIIKKHLLFYTKIPHNKKPHKQFMRFFKILVPGAGLEPARYF